MLRKSLFGVVVSTLVLTVVFLPVGTARGADDGLSAVPQVQVPFPDLAAVRAEDQERESQGQAPRFAIPNAVHISSATDGVWKDLDAKTRQWQLRIASPGALSLNLGFTAYYMPPGGQLWVYAADGSYALEPYTDFNNADHGQLWTAVVLSDDIVVEVTIPRALEQELILQLTSINVGYRGFGDLTADKSGACEIDVICPDGNGWRNDIPAIAVISTGGSAFCTGFMVNNTSQDQTPYFMTANHCGVTSGNAGSLVVYWNFFSPTCGQHGGGSLGTNQSGSTFRASSSTSDFTLVQLSQAPNPAWGITYSGWDRRDVQASSIVGIHHPNCDEKSISFSTNATFTSTYVSDTSPGDGTHLRVNWLPVATNRGATEPGSSGSPLFDQNHRVLGQLHGGYSACGASDMRDWYGRFFVSWTGGGTNSTRLSNWLDSAGIGSQYVDTLNPAVSGLEVTPSTGLSATGDVGGPFTPGSMDYTLHNAGTSAITYQVTNTQSWVSLTNASGGLAGGASTIVTVSINANANALGTGSYTDTITFTNTTNHQGDAQRGVALQVGVPHVLYSWNLDTDPGWPVQGQWAFGHPTGQGGVAHGHPDPNNGHTGANVYGVNLNGDYATTAGGPWWVTAGPINLQYATQTSLRFWRWLNSDYQPFAYATIQVSKDGTNWTSVWQNGGSVIQDAAWSQQTYDISGIANNQSAVWVRWGYQIASGAWAYSGWNIDDVEIWALSSCTGPAITGQPQSQVRRVGQSVTFSVTASGTSPGYQWRKGGGIIGGATSSSYTISPVATGDAGSYDCVVTNGCGSVTSNAAVLTVAHPGDMNCDGQVTFADIDLFVEALAGQSAWTHAPCPWLNGDCNGDESVTFADIDPFVALIGTRTQ